MHTPSGTPKVHRYSQLSIGRQMLVRLCQHTNYGSVRGLEIGDGEPVFDPPPVVQIDLKLDGDDPPRPEFNLRDFELSREVRRLLARLDDGNTAALELLEVRGGIPRRVVFRAGITCGISNRQAINAGAVAPAGTKS